MEKKSNRVDFSEGEIDFIKKNRYTMKLSQMAIALDRPYASVRTKVCELDASVQRGRNVKTKYILTPPKEKKFERPPAVYSNPQFHTLYDNLLKGTENTVLK